MKMEKPILFQGDMVRAILSGQKTQTRRIFKVTDPLGGQHAIRQPEKVIQLGRPGDLDDFHYESTGGLSGPYPCPYGQPGGRLWVRESCAQDLETNETVDLARYSADGTHVLYSGQEEDEQGEPDYGGSLAHWWYSRKSCPSIHMPRWASRLNLELLRVRCEPLQAITEADALAEGFLALKATGRIVKYQGAQHFGEYWHTARAAYRDLWDSINAAPSPVEKKGPDGKKYVSHYVSFPWEDKWEQAEHKGKMHIICGNPWVWVLDFKPYRREGGQTWTPII